MWDASALRISPQRSLQLSGSLYGFYHFCFDRLDLANFPFLKTQPLTTIPKVLSRLGEFDVMTLRRKRLKTWRIQTHC